MAQPSDFIPNFDAACRSLDMKNLTDEKLKKFLVVNCVVHWEELYSHINEQNFKIIKEQVREEYRYVRDKFADYLPIFPLSDKLLDDTETVLQFFKDDFPKPQGP